MIPGFNDMTEKSVRVFISSTFSDFYHEREILAMNVFPRLREHFEKRGISVTEIDLRWGLTDEQTQTKSVIDSCLDQIKECSPYFIGLVGGRTGWVPSKEDLQSATCINHIFPTGLHKEMSITEIEFHAGAFSKNNELALFFINDNVLHHEEPALTLLEKVEATFPRSSSHYDDMALFSEAAYTSLVSVIDKRFPLASAQSDLDPDYQAQLACLHQHVDTYVSGNEAVEFALSLLEQGQNVYLYGEKGTGKSASVAYLATELDLGEEADVFFRFCGATDNSSSEESLFDALGRFLTKTYGATGGSGRDSLDKMLSLFASVTLSRPLYVLVDAIDQLDTGRNICEALFTLSDTHPLVTCLCSGTQKLPLGKSRRRITLDGISRHQAEQMVVRYLSDYGKQLDKQDNATLLEGAVSRKPLLLRGALNELRIAGKYDTLSEFVKSISSISSVIELLSHIVRRVQTETELIGCDPRSILRALEAIRSTHRGITEDEIIRICAIPTMLWVSLRSALKPFLLLTGGRMRFNHQLIEQGASLLLEKETSIRDEVGSSKIIEYEANPKTNDRICELAATYSTLDDRHRFGTILCDSDTLQALLDTEPETMVRYFSLFHDEESVIVEHVIGSVETLYANRRACEALSWILCRSGCFECCIAFVKRLKDRRVTSIELDSCLARTYYKQGALGYDNACSTYDEAMEHVERENDPATYAQLLFQKSIVLKSAGDQNTALEYTRQAATLYEKSNVEDHNRAWCLSSLGRLLFLFGEKGSEEALTVGLNMGERVCGLRSPAFARLLCFELHQIAAGNLDKADKLTNFSAETLLEFSGENPDYAWAMANRAVYYAYREDFFHAREANEICARINNKTVKTRDDKHTYSFTSKNNELVFDAIEGHSVENEFHQLLHDATKTLGPRHPYVANITANLGFIESVSNPHQAIERIEEAAHILDKAIKANCPDALYLKLCAAILTQSDGLSRSMTALLENLAESDFAMRALLSSETKVQPKVQMARNNGAELYFTPFALELLVR